MVGLTLVIAVAAGIGVVSLAGGSTPPTGSARPSQSAPQTRPPIVAPAAPATTFRGFVYETSVITGPTATRSQSKLWFAQGAWWAGMVQPATNRVNIFQLDGATQRWIDTGVLVDDRPGADPDYLWTGDHLYVVTAGPRTSTRDAGRVLRFSFDAEAERFELDQNFPITIIGTGTPAAVIGIDTTGTLWVVWSAEGRIWITHSLDHDAHWAQPIALPVAGTTVDPDDIASLVAFGPGRIGVMWSNQISDNVYFSVHRDGDPPEVWSDPEIVIDGTGSSDGHINLKAYPTEGGTGVVAALKTSLDTGDRPNPLDPLILLAVRGDDETWTTHMAGQVRDRHTRAIVEVDEAARMFYVVATSPARGGAIYYKRTSIDDVRFETGRGDILIASDADPRINDPTGAKHGLGPETGLLVLASDDDTGRYLHAVMPLGGPPVTADPDDPARLLPPDPPDPLSPVPLVRQDFEPWAPGSADGTDWIVPEDAPPDALTIVDDGGGRSLRATATTDGRAVRACRDFSEIADGQLSITARVRWSGTGPTDTSPMLLRGSGGEAGSIRVTQVGDLAWFDGATKERMETGLAADRWYRIEATIDQGARTYAFEVTTDDGDRITRQTGLDWRSGAVRSVRTVCLQTTDGVTGQELDLSDVSVVVLPPG